MDYEDSPLFVKKTPDDQKLDEALRCEMEEITLSSPVLAPLTSPQLVILDKSIPYIFIKGDCLELDVAVEPFDHIVMPVRCEVLNCSGDSDKMVENIVLLDQTPLKSSYRLKFKMLKGSNLNILTLRFSATLTNGRLLESPVTTPFIIITNYVQYEIALKELIKMSLPMPWTQFGELLQYHFKLATKQSDRPLSLSEVAYFKKKYFSRIKKETVKANTSFDIFWNWFGQVVQRLRCTKGVCALWRAGLIWSFCSRDDVEPLLMTEKVGTFLVRFSETHPGQFAVAYKTSRVHHYHVNEDDIKAKTLADYIGDTPQFVLVIRWTETRSACTVQKYEAFEEFYTRKEHKNRKDEDDDYEHLLY